MKKTGNPDLMQEKRDKFLLQVKPEKQLDFKLIFHNQNPVYLEIGSGKGEFISGYSLLHQDWNFIGFELKSKRIDIILRKLDLEMHENVRLATFMIDKSIGQIIPDDSVHGVFIQHPDPWPKRKHFKRRLVQKEFLDALSQIIKTGGIVQVSTDHTEYAQWIWKEFSGRQDFVARNSEGMSTKPMLGEHIITYYEREQRRLGYEPRHMLFQKL
jgi:tRNA (guanine-N7-)-methyltransferase